MTFFGQKLRFRSCIRVLVPAVLLVCFIFMCSGCKEEKPPEDKSFFIAKTIDGAEFRLGENGEVIGRLELPREDFEGGWRYTGEMRFYRGDEVWIRVWQETDQMQINAYIQSPGGASELNSWQKEEDGKSHNTLEYSLVSEKAAEDDGVSVSIVSPLGESTVIAVLLSVDTKGTLQLNTYIEREGTDKSTRCVSEHREYRLLENTWNETDCVLTKTTENEAPGQQDNPQYGDAELLVDIHRDGESRKFTWNRTGLAEDGVRYLARCEKNGQQTLLLQTLEDPFGAVTTETANFPKDMPFPGDADGQVRTVDGRDLTTGISGVYRYRFDGTLETGMVAEILRKGDAGGFAAELFLTDELYEGDRAADTELTDPKGRRYAFYRFSDSLTGVSVDVPVMRGEWVPGRTLSIEKTFKLVKLSVQPRDMDGWTILGTPADEEQRNSDKPSELGEIALGTVSDAVGNKTYTGDLRIFAPGADEFRLYRTYDGVRCRVMAEFAGQRWEVATCAPENGGAPLLSVSRYVEMDDYPTPAVLRKALYSVSLPDGTPVAQVITTNDGRVQVELHSADGTTLCEFLFRCEDGTIRVHTSKTESAGTGAVRTERTYHGKDGTFSVAVSKERGKDSSENEGTRYEFACTKGTLSEAVFSVFVTDDSGVTIDECRIAEESAGKEIVLAQIKGGLLYIDNVCIDAMSILEDPDASLSTTLNGTYYPITDGKTFLTEDLQIAVCLSYEYIPAKKTKDGTVLNPASARKIAWLEIHERNVSGDSWSIPLGCGSWRTVTEQ